MFRSFFLLALLLTLSCSTTEKEKKLPVPSGDPREWLEEVEGAAALKWVEEQNQKTYSRLSSLALYSSIEKKSLELLNAQDRIPQGQMRRGYVYNFWQDSQHVRGLWRRTPLKSYRSKKINWEILLDLDQLASAEKENWVYKGVDCVPPLFERCLITLSRGGKDASVIREFDLKKKEFVKAGFNIPEAKTRVTWKDMDTLIVGTDFGPGTLTNSGYPRQLKLWKRGQSLAEASMLLEGKPEDVSVSAHLYQSNRGNQVVLSRAKTFYTAENYLLTEALHPLKLDIPEDIDLLGIIGDQFIALLKSDWKSPAVFKQGSVVGISLSQLILGKNKVHTILAPREKMSVHGVDVTEKALYIETLDHVEGQIYAYTPVTPETNITWKSKRLDLPGKGKSDLTSSDYTTGHLFITFENFLNPTGLYEVTSLNDKPKLIKSLPSRFPTAGYVIEQKEARSSDGTLVNYFIVRKKSTKMDGKTPTLLYSYGGFEISMTPQYSPYIGNFWLEKGGAYVLANIRGGGEYGPAWHQAALKGNRQLAYDDFYAVATDLIQSKLTSPAHLGIMGGSNGGLLVGVAYTQRPELFGAVVCQVPLLDMLRYTKLLAGASWVAEYGDPEKASERNFLEKISPYHNIKPNQKYPPIIFMTSTKDDRVHPGHARKMASRLLEEGHSIDYYENTEGGHGGVANLKQRAKWQAIQYSFLWEKLGN